MQDTIILGNGTSKQIKTASLPNNYAEFKAMAENGNLFADISLNADGCEVVGTPLNKLNLLTDETSQKLNGVQNVDEALLQMLSIIPIGTVLPNASPIVPELWLICDGSAISRTTYADLFNAIGTTYGTGDGSTTFNLPNLKGKIPVGYDANDTDFNTVGKTGGEKTHTLTVNEMPSHSHSSIVNGVKWVSGGNTEVSDKSGGYGLPSGTTGSTGGGQAHNIIQPYITMNYIIYAGV